MLRRVWSKVAGLASRSRFTRESLANIWRKPAIRCTVVTAGSGLFLFTQTPLSCLPFAYNWNKPGKNERNGSEVLYYAIARGDDATTERIFRKLRYQQNNQDNFLWMRKWFNPIINFDSSRFVKVAAYYDNGYALEKMIDCKLVESFSNIRLCKENWTRMSLYDDPRAAIAWLKNGGSPSKDDEIYINGESGMYTSKLLEVAHQNGKLHDLPVVRKIRSLANLWSPTKPNWLRMATMETIARGEFNPENLEKVLRIQAEVENSQEPKIRCAERVMMDPMKLIDLLSDPCLYYDVGGQKTARILSEILPRLAATGSVPSVLPVYLLCHKHGKVDAKDDKDDSQIGKIQNRSTMDDDG